MICVSSFIFLYHAKYRRYSSSYKLSRYEDMVERNAQCSFVGAVGTRAHSRHPSCGQTASVNIVHIIYHTAHTRTHRQTNPNAAQPKERTIQDIRSVFKSVLG